MGLFDAIHEAAGEVQRCGSGLAAVGSDTAAPQVRPDTVSPEIMRPERGVVLDGLRIETIMSNE